MTLLHLRKEKAIDNKEPVLEEQLCSPILKEKLSKHIFRKNEKIYNLLKTLQTQNMQV